MTIQELLNHLVTEGILLEMTKDHYHFSDGSAKNWAKSRCGSQTVFSEKDRFEKKFPEILPLWRKSSESKNKSFPSKTQITGFFSDQSRTKDVTCMILRAMVLVEGQTDLDERGGEKDPFESLLNYFISSDSNRLSIYNKLTQLRVQWATYHYSFLGSDTSKKPILVKGILNISRTRGIFYRGHVEDHATRYVYKGNASLEESTIVMRLKGRNTSLKENLTFRLFVGNLRPEDRPSEIDGLLSGITLSSEPVASKIRITKISSKPDCRSEQNLPHNFEFLDESYACEGIGDHKKFFAYGPKGVTFHREWSKDRTQEIMSAIKDSPDGSHLDILATSIPLTDHFQRTIELIFKEHPQYGIRVVMSDPSSEIFLLRYALRFKMKDDFLKMLEQQKKVYESLEMICQYYQPSDSPERGVRFTQAWISGLSLMTGNGVLFKSSQSTSQPSVSAHQLEIRDDCCETAINFKKDFNLLWKLENQLSHKLDITTLDLDKIANKWYNTKQRLRSPLQ